MKTKGNYCDVSFDITDGPSRDRLIDAFKYAYDVATQLDIEFTIVRDHSRLQDNPGYVAVPMKAKEVVVNTIQHENGTSNDFNIKGWCRVEDTGVEFRAYYNARTRTGTITISFKKRTAQV